MSVSNIVVLFHCNVPILLQELSVRVEEPAVRGGTQRGGRKLICTTVCLEKLFVANLQNQ